MSEVAGAAVAVRPGLLRVGLATLVSALLTWLVQALAGRFLSLSGFVDFMTVWGLFFAILGVLQGVQQETTRSVSAGMASDAPGGRPLRGALALGGAGTVVALLTAPLWLTLLPVSGTALLPLALSLLVYALFNAVGGGLAGLRAWRGYALLILLEALIRTALVTAVVLSGAGLTWLGWSLVCAGVAAPLVVALPGFRATLDAKGDAPPRVFVRRTLHSMFAAGCSALTLAGFPFLLVVTARGPVPDSAAVLIAAVVATRAPLLITLNAYQGAAIVRFVGAGDRAVMELRRAAVVVGAAALAAAVVSYWVGPPVLSLMYGAGFVAPGWLFVTLVLSAGAMSVFMLSGSACVAREQHVAYAVGWLCAVLVLMAGLLLPLSLDVRALGALLAAPLVGLGVQVVALERRAGPLRA